MQIERAAQAEFSSGHLLAQFTARGDPIRKLLIVTNDMR